MSTSKTIVSLSILSLFIAATTVAAAADTAAPTAEGRVTAVTLYRGQAMVTRTVPVEVPAGSQELVVPGLPEQIVPGSLYAEAGEALEIRAVRFRVRAVGEEPREEVRSLEDKMDAIRDRLQVNEKEQQVLAQHSAYLEKMEGFTVQTGHTDLARGFLDAAALEKLTTFAFDQREAINAKQVVLEKEAKDTNKDLQVLERKRAELTSGHQESVREAVIFLEKGKEGKESLRLNYLVGNCGWSPTYTVRAGKDRKEMDLECSALINQLTGEDWTGVKLTLSTASPALAASSPGLAPLAISLVPAGQTARLSETEVRGGAVDQWKEGGLLGEATGRHDLRGKFRQQLGRQLRRQRVPNVGVGHGKGRAQPARLAPRKRGPQPHLPTCRRGEPGEPIRPANGAGLPVELQKRLLLRGRTRAHQPGLPRGRTAQHQRRGPAGRADHRLSRRPLHGPREIMTVARGQTFVVGFGADPQLRARRELADRNEALQGGNRELAFKYRLVVENFKKEPVPVRVFDRLPYSDRTNDVRVRLGDLKDVLSTDKVYLRTERPKGLLRWDITVDGVATADKTRIVDYGFTIDFDRNLAIQLQRGGDEMANDNSGGAGMGGLGGGMGGGFGGGGGQAAQAEARQPRHAAADG